jgi:uncharacterized protein (TIGR02246 family)
VSQGTELDQAALQRLVDESDLRKLMLAMPRCLDMRDWDGYGNLFTEDAIFEIAGQVRVGRQAIADGPRGDLEKLYERTRHFMGNIYIDVDGDEAHIVSYVIAVHIPVAADMATHADVGGGYRAIARRTDEGWRFTECHVDMFWASGAEFKL